MWLWKSYEWQEQALALVHNFDGINEVIVCLPKFKVVKRWLNLDVHVAEEISIENEEKAHCIDVTLEDEWEDLATNSLLVKFYASIDRWKRK